MGYCAWSGAPQLGFVLVGPPLHDIGLKGGTPKALKVLPLFFFLNCLYVCLSVDKLQVTPRDGNKENNLAAKVADNLFLPAK